MTNLQQKTREELMKKLLDNRYLIRRGKISLEEGRQLIREDHEIMKELDRRLAAAEKELLASRK